jgi:hypothetical protein
MFSAAFSSACLPGVVVQQMLREVAKWKVQQKQSRYSAPEKKA